MRDFLDKRGVSGFEPDAVLGGAPTSTGDVTFMHLRYLSQSDVTLGLDQSGVLLSGIELSGHKAFTIGRIESEICGALEPAGLLLGSYGIGGQDAGSVAAYRARASACAGVRLGRVGTLRDTISYDVNLSVRDIQGTDEKTGEMIPTNTTMVSQRMSNALSLENIGGTGLRASYTYERGSSDSGEGGESRGYSAHIFGAGVAF